MISFFPSIPPSHAPPASTRRGAEPSRSSREHSDAGHLLRPSPSPAHAPSVADVVPGQAPNTVGRLGVPCRRIRGLPSGVKASCRHPRNTIPQGRGTTWLWVGVRHRGGKVRTRAKAREELGGARAAGRTAARHCSCPGASQSLLPTWQVAGGIRQGDGMDRARGIMVGGGESRGLALR